MYAIISEKLKVLISAKGAEPIGVFANGYEHNWLWSGQAPWQRSAPLLFPIVGRLKADSFSHEGRNFSLAQHGFARDEVFDVEFSSQQKINLCLRSNSRTSERFPFDFVLGVSYEVLDARLLAKYTVQNVGREVMYFNLGWHPGFVLPRHESSKKKLSSPKSFHKYSLLDKGLLNFSSQVDLFDVHEVDIKSNSFASDAWVFVNSGQREVNLSNESGDMISVKANAPHWGVWSNDPLKFVCIEPWWGHADVSNGSGELKDKQGIQSLDPGTVWHSEAEVEFRFGRR
ncbi:hypothetical protein [Bdellovibrio sp. HCB2-146]|uniref:aldose epimerase family protein n=1 Tax=Bdellovibrio sp. HCB2-146 TaxID=3394362 RepID=UPI0039BD6E16